MESRTALTRVPPTSAEAEALHSFYLKAGQYEDGYIPTPSHLLERVWMSDTTIEKSQLMFPQSRNSHSKIFGGTDLAKAAKAIIPVRTLSTQAI